MTLYEKIQADMKAAMKGREELKLSVIRMLLAAVRNMEIEKKVQALDDPGIVQIIQKQIKQHQDSIEQFRKGGREDLAAKEASELKILGSYMPPQLAPEALIGLIEGEIRELGASTRKDAGKVMKSVMEKAKGRADGKVVSQLVMERLP